jgi:hypothetical protein
VRAQVRLQVRRLGVGLTAPGLVAYVQRRRFALQDNHNLLLLLLLLLLQMVVGMGMEGRGQG